jgi:hypothetical protein
MRFIMLLLVFFSVSIHPGVSSADDHEAKTKPDQSEPVAINPTQGVYTIHADRLKTFISSIRPWLGSRHLNITVSLEAKNLPTVSHSITVGSLNPEYCMIIYREQLRALRCMELYRSHNYVEIVRSRTINFTADTRAQ